MRENSNNASSIRHDGWHFVVMALIEGVVILINFIGMLFAALQIKSNVLIWQILPSLFVFIQVPLLPVLLGFTLYSLGFLFIHRKSGSSEGNKRIRNLIGVHVAYVLYFMVMFTYWGVSAMSLPQPITSTQTSTTTPTSTATPTSYGHTAAFFTQFSGK